eukprot:3585201-Lingulodinium_polyedra.AAC.1
MAPVVKFRVACNENVANGGMRARARASELRGWLASSDDVARRNYAAHIPRRAFCTQLEDAV